MRACAGGSFFSAVRSKHHFLLHATAAELGGRTGHTRRRKRRKEKAAGIWMALIELVAAKERSCPVIFVFPGLSNKRFYFSLFASVMLKQGGGQYCRAAFCAIRPLVFKT